MFNSNIMHMEKPVLYFSHKKTPYITGRTLFIILQPMNFFIYIEGNGILRAYEWWEELKFERIHKTTFGENKA